MHVDVEYNKKVSSAGSSITLFTCKSSHIVFNKTSSKTDEKIFPNYENQNKLITNCLSEPGWVN